MAIDPEGVRIQTSRYSISLLVYAMEIQASRQFTDVFRSFAVSKIQRKYRMTQSGHQPRAFRGVQFTFHSQLFDELIATDAMERFLRVPACEKALALVAWLPCCSERI